MSAELARAVLNELLDRLERQPKRVREITRTLPQSFDAAGDRDSFTALLRSAERMDAVRLVEGRGELSHLLSRIYLVSADALYAFLERTPKADADSQAADRLLASLAPEIATCGPARALAETIAQSWRQGRRAYSLGPRDMETAQDFLLCVAAAAAGDFGGQDMRTISRRRTGRSKLIEKHQVRLARWIRDQGFADEGTEDKDALKAIGLEKFPQDVKIAGPLLCDDRTVPEMSYLGVPTDAVTRLSAADSARTMITIENLASFNRYVREARRPDELVLFTGGYPSAAVGQAIARLSPGLEAIHHWGDIDAHGLRIAMVVARHAGRPIHLLQMTPELAQAHGAPAAPDAIELDDGLGSDFQRLAQLLGSADARTLEQEELDPVSPLPLGSTM